MIFIMSYWFLYPILIKIVKNKILKITFLSLILMYSIRTIYVNILPYKALEYTNLILNLVLEK